MIARIQLRTCVACACAASRCTYPAFDNENFFWEFSNEYDHDITFPAGTRAMVVCTFGHELIDPAHPFSECVGGSWTPIQGCTSQSPGGSPTDEEVPDDRCQRFSVYGVAEGAALFAFEACIEVGCIACGDIEQGTNTCVAGFDGMSPNTYLKNVCPYMETVWNEETCPQTGCGVRDTPAPFWSVEGRKRRTIMTQAAKVGDECGSPMDPASMTITMDFGETGECRPGSVDSDGPLRYFQWHCESDGAVLQVFEDPMCMDFFEEKRASELPSGCFVQPPSSANSPAIATLLSLESPCGSDDHCSDWPRDWKDVAGSGCSYYEMGGFCDESWVERLADASGVHARIACCACGGGQNEVPRSTWTAPGGSAQVLPLWLDVPSGVIEGSMQHSSVFQFTLPAAPSNASDLRIVVRPSRDDPFGARAHVCCGSMGDMYGEPDAREMYTCAMAPVARGHSAPRPNPSGIWGRADSSGEPGARNAAPLLRSFTWPARTTPRPRDGQAVVVRARGIGSLCDLRKPLSLVVFTTVPFEVHARLQAPDAALLPLPAFYVQTAAVSPGSNGVVFEFKVPRRARSLQFPVEVVGSSVSLTAVWNHWQPPMGPVAGEQYLLSEMPSCIDVTGNVVGTSLFFKFHSADGFAKIRIQALVNGDGLCDFFEAK